MKNIYLVVERIYKYKIWWYIISFAACLIVLGVLSVTSYSQHKVGQIADEVIRFHVVANSDTIEDQLLKQQVKNEVIEYMRPMLIKSKSIEDTRIIIKDNMDVIERIAKEVVSEWNKEYSIYVALDEANFPMKSYGDIVLPAGQYEACRIILGEGRGQNWWCILFPPLCYVDASSKVISEEDKEELKELLDDESYKIITSNKNDTDKKYYIRFKLVDTVNQYLNKEDYKQK